MIRIIHRITLESGRIGSARELPVTVDLEWLGKTITSPDAGILQGADKFKTQTMTRLED